MTSILYLAWRYLAYHRYKTAILVLSITLIAFLPVGLQVLVRESAEQLISRAQATPLVLGARGSPLELVLNSLYFESATPQRTTYAEVEKITESGLAAPIPLYVRFRSRGNPIVGTTLEYFDFRGLRVATGRRTAMLGECVLGAKVAEELGAGPGATVVSSPESVFDLAGVYPLKMNVVGVLAPSHTPDDVAVFVDVKTAWVIEGLVHGHQDLAAPEAASAVLKREEGRIVANASVVQYNEITEDNIDSFHFHGDLGAYPLSAVIAVPHDDKSRVILMGRYQGEDETAQIVSPEGVIDDLLGTVFTVESYVVAALVLVGLATCATTALVFLLSLRLRRREIQTMVKIGAARLNVAGVVASEIVVVFVASAFLAGMLTLLVSRFGSAAIRALLLG
jgi:putative ABC transport system permease protein